MLRKKAIVLSISIVLLCLCTLGITLGYLTKTMFGKKEVSVVTGTLKVDFEDSNFLSLDNATPMSDRKGQELEPYTFTITNTGNITAYYQIGFEEDPGNTLNTRYVKMRMIGDNGYDSDIMSRDNFQEILLNEQALEVNETVTYQLWLWLDEDADNSVQGTIYQSKVVVNAQSSPYENRYCYENGFTNLNDCMLVMEKESGSVEEAKEMIASKGTPDFSKIAPEVSYQEVTTNMNNENGVITTTQHFTLGKGYTFDESTGMFTLTDYHNNPLTEEYLDYYTCGSTAGTTTTCSIMYQIKEFTTTTDSSGNITYRVTKAVRHTMEESETSVANSGLYAAVDDNGTSYYYRGAVKNNYVSFAGYIWRIIRINGDGSIRMIYSGTSPSATGSETSIGSSAYNSKYWDPTYIGYKYSENFSLHENENAAISYTNFQENTNYYFGEGYAFDENSKTFHLTGNTIQGKWSEVGEEAISSYPYTCFSTSSTGTCNIILQVTRYTNAYTAVAKPISYSSIDYNSILQNTTDSTIKDKIDAWYAENLLSKTDEEGNKWSSYLSDEVFCNDRSLHSGSGYLVSPITYFSAYNRLANEKNPTLKCIQDSDRFTVDSENGNGELDYPIGLITIDEVSMAGGVYSTINTRYYLYTEQSYWTLSPCCFNSTYMYGNAWRVLSTGYLHPWSNTAASLGIRPVINLRPDVQITSGDGSAAHPFVVTYN